MSGTYQSGQFPTPGTQFPNTATVQGAAPASFLFSQQSPSSTWIIVHNLNKAPVHVTAVDTTNAPLEGAESYDSPNQVTVVFSAAVSGIAYVS